MKSYLPAILLSLIGHAVLVVLVVWGWSAAEPTLQLKSPSFIRATLVEIKEKSVPQPEAEPKVEVVAKTEPKVVPKPVPKPVPPKPEPKKNDDQVQKKKIEAEKKAEQLRIKKAEAKKAEQRKNQLAKEKADAQKKAEAEKKKQVDEQKKQEALAEQEKQRKQDLLKELELERQQELARAVAAEKARLQAQQQAAADSALAQSYESIIAARVSSNWSRPPSARNGMKVSLRIQLVPTGNVIGVDVTKSSGDAAFDRSAKRAVERSESFPELRELPTRVFETTFRTFNFEFEPEDLRQ